VEGQIVVESLKHISIPCGKSIVFCARFHGLFLQYCFNFENELNTKLGSFMFGVLKKKEKDTIIFENSFYIEHIYGTNLNEKF
jgi:hypothetical protein